MSNTWCFEQGFNELSRIFLKLDELFTTIKHSFHHSNLDSNRLALDSLLHIATLLDRPDFKSKLVKELHRLHAIFQRLIHSDKVDQHKLHSILYELRSLLTQLQSTEGKLAQSLRDNDFLNSIRLQQANPGGACFSEIPSYQLWLTQSCQEQQHDLHFFNDQIQLTQQATSLVLQLMRESAVPQRKIAHQGFYQMSLDAQLPWQLLRLHLPKQTLFFPETSIGRHGISVRFYYLKTQDKRRYQTDQDIPFNLSICCL